MTRERRALPLALRLAAAFLAVAVAAVAVLAALIIVSARREVAGLVRRQRTADAQAAAAAVAQAYDAAGGWNGVQLAAAVAVAARSDAGLVVTTADGRTVPTVDDQMAAMMARMHGVAAVPGSTAPGQGDAVTAPVVAASGRVGDVTLTFPTGDVPSPERQLRQALGRTAMAGAVAAAAVALVVALYVGTRLTRPLSALTTAAGRLSQGDLSARAGATGAPGELGELAAAFDAMAASLEHEDQLRRSLVGDLAHELRTPLTILRAQTEALVDGVTPPDQATMVSLHDEVLRLTRLVADLETLAAADAARLHLDAGPVDLADVASAVADEARATADGVTITVEAAPTPVSGDGGRLHQIALNLLANAVKFTPAGGSVTVRSWSDAGGAHLEVLDTGPGLAPGEQDVIFDRFSQGGAGKAAGGSGIGLAVAAELAGAHGGTLTAANRPAGGARFTLTLPKR